MFGIFRSERLLQPKMQQCTILMSNNNCQLLQRNAKNFVKTLSEAQTQKFDAHQTLGRICGAQ